MWHEGSLKVEGEIIHYWVKTCTEPSATYGIEGGRIIKMSLKKDGRWTLNYDRGWDQEPEDEASQLAYAILMKEYN